MKCFNCQKKLEGRYQKKFCSQSCAATFNNKICKKGKGVKRNCPRCKKEFLKQELPTRCLCFECKEEKKNNLLYNKDLTKKELVYEKHTHGAAYSYIRWHSRKVVLKDHPKICSVCGYDRHAEVAHRIPISDFPDDAKLSEINSISNLVLLCPNHHWEFDHGRSGGT